MLLQGAEFVVALTHMRGPNDRRLAEQATGIDLILGGHDHDYFSQKVFIYMFKQMYSTWIITILLWRTVCVVQCNRLSKLTWSVNQYNIIFHVVVLCWCVDSLVCRLHNYSKKLIFKEFVH